MFRLVEFSEIFLRRVGSGKRRGEEEATRKAATYPFLLLSWRNPIWTPFWWLTHWARYDVICSEKVIREGD